MKQKIGYREYKAPLKAFINLLQQALGEQLISVVLYGSVARGTARPESDVDLLLILRETPAEYWKRLEPLLPILKQLRAGSFGKSLAGQEMKPFLSLLVLSPEEAKENRYLYLDMSDEARITFDRRRGE